MINTIIKYMNYSLLFLIPLTVIYGLINIIIVHDLKVGILNLLTALYCYILYKL